MEIIRFDEDVSIEVTAHGSRFGIGPLTGDDTHGRVQMLHLPPDGLIGRHRTHGRQLLAVVQGEGWVSGEDGDRRSIRSGWGVIFEPGESHEAGSEAGLVAVCIEGDFERWAIRVTQDIVVADYDTRWPAWFDEIAAHVWLAVRDVAIRVDHVGSTSVPGLAAKPIIDMDIVVGSDDATALVIERLGAIGYRWRGDLGVTGRQAFSVPADPVLPSHHLYLVVESTDRTSTTSSCAICCEPTPTPARGTRASSDATPRPQIETWTCTSRTRPSSSPSSSVVREPSEASPKSSTGSQARHNEP